MTADQAFDAFGREIDRGIRMPSAYARADRAGGLKRYRHRTDHGLARPSGGDPLQDDAGAANTLTMGGQHPEDAILGVCTNLRVARLVFADHFDNHGQEQQAAEPAASAPRHSPTSGDVVV
jgi:hypothetical protein